MLTVDDLILDLIEHRRLATSDELAVIVAHVAQAPYATYISRVPVKLRQVLAAQGIIVPIRLSSLQRHLYKRVYDEQQWPINTTAGQYINDLHQAVTHPYVRIWTYYYLSQPFVGFLAPSHVQNAVKPEAHIFVAYSPVYMTLTTGYQANSIQTVFDETYTNLLRHK